MKITVFNGSPRGRESNTHIMVESFLDGAKSSGANVENIFLIEKHIDYCTGCFKCWYKTPGKCIHKDDMLELLDTFLNSDIVGYATPVYGNNMTSILMRFLERMLPLASPFIKRSEDGRFYHEGKVSKIPQFIVFSNSGFPGKHNFELLKTIFRPYNPIFEIYEKSGEILKTNHPDILKKVKNFKRVLREAGKEIVKNNQVSEETYDSLQKEIISDEDYINIVNQNWNELLKDNE